MDNLDDEAEPQAAEPRENTDEEPADTLPGLVRLVLAHQLTVLYKAAGGKEPEGFQRKVCEASDKEIQQAAALALPLSQVNAAVELYTNINQQLEIASTLTITIGKEAADHE